MASTATDGVIADECISHCVDLFCRSHCGDVKRPTCLVWDERREEQRQQPLKQKVTSGVSRGRRRVFQTLILPFTSLLTAGAI